MAKGMSRAHEEHLRELLQSSPLARDALPYTGDFARLKEEFYDRTFKKLTDEEFWLALVGAAKKGGVTGKARIEESVQLTDEQEHVLRKFLPIPIGQRDRLPYTELFRKLVVRFNTYLGAKMTEREVWICLLRLAK